MNDPSRTAIALKRFRILAVCLGLSMLILVSISATSTFRRFDSPDGRYYALIQYRSWRKYVPNISLRPVIAFNPPGFITIFTSSGVSCGRAPIPRAHFADYLVWHGDTADISDARGRLALWDLASHSVTVYPLPKYSE